jgi:hypothetical protein
VPNLELLNPNSAHAAARQLAKRGAACGAKPDDGNLRSWHVTSSGMGRLSRSLRAILPHAAAVEKQVDGDAQAAFPFLRRLSPA